jgi:septal ring factor EnvC (AmiA/AmiB activator)
MPNSRAALAHLEEEAEVKDRTIEKLGDQIYVLEDENDRMKEESERIRDEEAAERDRLEGLCAALKDVRRLALFRDTIC